MRCASWNGSGERVIDDQDSHEDVKRHDMLAHFTVEDGEGKPSRWNTLRAMRILEWFGRRSDR